MKYISTLYMQFPSGFCFFATRYNRVPAFNVHRSHLSITYWRLLSVCLPAISNRLACWVLEDPRVAMLDNDNRWCTRHHIQNILTNITNKETLAYSLDIYLGTTYTRSWICLTNVFNLNYTLYYQIIDFTIESVAFFPQMLPF